MIQVSFSGEVLRNVKQVKSKGERFGFPLNMVLEYEFHLEKQQINQLRREDDGSMADSVPKII
jgi:hypothetical protein